MRIATLAAVVALCGCASVQMASRELDAQAKRQAAPPGKALIYVFRNERIGGAIKMEVMLDGRIAGKTAPMTFFMFVVDPGPHEITSEAENTETLVVNAEVGKVYFMWQEVKMGAWFARNKLQMVDEATGRKGVEECELIASRL